MMTPLKTLKGSRIWYSKFGVGKQVGSKIYAHINHHDKIIPDDVWDKAVSVLIAHNYKLADFKCFCYDLKNPTVLRFDEAKGFDTEREPIVGVMVGVTTKTEKIVKTHSPQIWHHKWCWVEKDYAGFDVQESYDWSKLWLSKLTETASGYIYKWKAQLNKVGLE